jgi:hypothetical protein
MGFLVGDGFDGDAGRQHCERHSRSAGPTAAGGGGDYGSLCFLLPHVAPPKMILTLPMPKPPSRRL